MELIAENEQIKDHYGALGLEPDARKEEIKKAYRKLSKTMHPDVNKAENAKEEFAKIFEAYEVLYDEDMRKAYDEELERVRNGKHTWDFSKLFKQYHPTETNLGVKGEDVRITVPFTVEEVVQDKPILFDFERYVACESCEGVGYHRLLEHRCSSCKGIGKSSRSVRTPFGTLDNVDPCPACKGSGYTSHPKCETCDGKGQFVKKVTLQFTLIPPITSKMIQKFQYRGDDGIRGGVPGDLIVEFIQSPNDQFSIVNGAVEYTATIPYEIALNGGNVQVPLPTGKDFTVTIPERIPKDYMVVIPDCLLYTSPSPRD